VGNLHRTGSSSMWRFIARLPGGSDMTKSMIQRYFTLADETQMSQTGPGSPGRSFKGRACAVRHNMCQGSRPGEGHLSSSHCKCAQADYNSHTSDYGPQDPMSCKG